MRILKTSVQAGLSLKMDMAPHSHTFHTAHHVRTKIISLATCAVLHAPSIRDGTYLIMATALKYQQILQLASLMLQEKDAILDVNEEKGHWHWL